MLTRSCSVLLWLCALASSTRAQAPCPSLGPDRLTYTQHAGPVLEAGTQAWEAGGVLHIAVCQVGERFYMYYTGLAHPGYGYRSIGLATSDDGIHWKRESTNPVLSRGDVGAFDDVHVRMPSVLHDSSTGQFRMWYVGYQNNRGNTIGYAESPDGLAWEKRGQVLSYGADDAFDSGSLREPTVIYDPATQLFKMWYNGTMPGQHYGPTGYAISEDGLHWGRVAAINGDQRRFIGLHVILDGECYHGWYGTGPEIGYGRSTDGIHREWRNPEVVISPTPDGDHTRYVQAPVALIDKNANHIRLWYNGASGDQETLTVGYADARLP